MKAWSLALLVAIQPASAFAQTDADALRWLERIYSATKRLNYSGTFIYQTGRHTETSRITHLVDADGVQERIEILDGSPREIVRQNDEVRCYLPNAMTVKVERIATDRRLLPIVPSRVAELQERYKVSKGGVERIAGYECQSIVLEPKDTFRYGHRFWADIDSAMIVKAQTLDEHNEVVEQFVFTQLSVGGPIPRDRVESKFATIGRGWQIIRSDVLGAAAPDSRWVLGQTPPGFHKLAELRRRLGTSDLVNQIVLSDGLAAVSIFIEKNESKASTARLGASRQGAINIFARKVDNHLVTVVGDAPAECVRVIAHALELRPGQ